MHRIKMAEQHSLAQYRNGTHRAHTLTTILHKIANDKMRKRTKTIIIGL